MLWELIAAAFAGLSGAGIAMGLRFVIKRLPKWIIPVMAGVCMLTFTIYSEYSWYNHTKNRLPDHSVVVHTVPHTAFYKPWSYAYPQILQFVVLDKRSIKPIGDGQYQALLYFFERRFKTEPLAVTINCHTQEERLGNANWQKSQMSNTLVANVCTSP